MKQKLLNSLRLRACMLVAVLCAGVSAAWGDSWTRVTSTSELLEGGTFILGYEATANNGVIIPMRNSGTATISAAGYMYSGTADSSTGTIDMSNVTETSQYEVTIVASTSVQDAICIKIGDNYLGNANTKNNCKLFVEESINTAFTPTIGDNNVVTLKINANETYHTLQYNSGSPRFAVYGGTQKNLVIYKKVSGGSSISFAPIISGETFFETNTTVTLSAAEGAAIYYTTDGTTPTTGSAQYSAPFTLTETATVKAFAVESGKAPSSVVENTFTKVEALDNIEAVANAATSTATTGFVNLNSAVVTYVNGSYAYIQDASGAIVMYKNGHGLNAGDVFNGIAEVTYQLRNENPQLTNLSGVTPTAGTAPDPIEIAASAWNSTISDELSKYYKITGATITKTNNKYYITLGSETVQLYGQGEANPVSVSDLNATYTIVGFPTLYNDTPELQIFVQPEAETVTREEVTMTFTGGNIEFTNVADFEAPTLSITDESGEPVTGLTITYSSDNTDCATVDASTGVVTIVGYGEAKITATFAGNDNYVEATASYTIKYSSTDQGDYTWDLTKSSYSSADENLVTWSSDFGSMTLAKEGSTTAANNYLGGTNNHTRFYKDQVLSITPATGYKITSVVITATGSSYVAGFTGNNWNNATTSTSGTTITVTPTNGKEAMSVTISAACRATSVKVFYEASTEPSIAITSPLEVNSDEAEGTLDVTYLYIEDNSSAQLILCDEEGTVATYNWIVAELNNDKDIDYIIEANTGDARTAYLKVMVGDVSSNIVTITQAGVDYASLPFAYDGNGAMITDQTGVTAEGLGTYNESPAIKFDSEGDWLVLKMNEAPKYLSFDIQGKGSGTWSGTFSVQTSADGEAYTDLATFTELSGEIESKSFSNIDTNVRYIKWVFTSKTKGFNVALGNMYAGNAPEAYAVVVNDAGKPTSVTFYYNGEKASHESEGEIVDIVDGTNEWENWTGNAASISLIRATFDESFGNFNGLKSLRNWFSYTGSLVIEGMGNLKTDNVESMSGMFMNSGVKSVDLSHFNTSKVTDMSYMFYNSNSLISLDVSSFVTEKVTNMSNMFRSCSSLTSLDVSNFDTQNVTNMSAMFHSCSSLTSLDVSSFDTKKVTNMSEMFRNNGQIVTIYVGEDWNTDAVTSSNNMFLYCNKLVGGNGTVYNSSNVNKTYARIDGKGGNGYLSDKNNKYVTVGSTGYTTYVPKAIVTIPADVTAYIVTEINESSIHMEPVTGAILAGTAIVVKASENWYKLPIAESATADVSANLLRASDGSVEGDGSTIYALGVGKEGDAKGKVGFYRVKKDAKVPAGKAYLVEPTGDAKDYLAFEEETDGIGQIENGALNMENATIYNLNGQRVNNAQKGIYIVNGKKVVVK